MKEKISMILVATMFCMQHPRAVYPLCPDQFQSNIISLYVLIPAKQNYLYINMLWFSCVFMNRDTIYCVCVCEGGG